MGISLHVFKNCVRTRQGSATTLPSGKRNTQLPEVPERLESLTTRIGHVTRPKNTEIMFNVFWSSSLFWRNAATICPIHTSYDGSSLFILISNRSAEQWDCTLTALLQAGSWMSGNSVTKCGVDERTNSTTRPNSQPQSQMPSFMFFLPLHAVHIRIVYECAGSYTVRCEVNNWDP